MPPTLALATRRADVEDADSAEAVALLWTLIEQTDCVATSELGDVGVIAVVLFVEIVRIAGSVLMRKSGARAAGRRSRADELDVVKVQALPEGIRL